MPSAPLRLCAAPGCQTLVTHGQCVAHRQAQEQVRGTRHQRGYTNRWAAYSKARLARYPLCVGYPHGYHGSTPTLATCTDHVLSARAHPDRFWDERNHQSLCADCNRRKGIAEEGGLGR